jgi:hypothetical protein
MIGLSASSDLPYQIGDRVRHYGTQQWGRVLEVKPWPLDGTDELRVRREPASTGFAAGTEGWWSSHRVDQHEPLTWDEVQAAFRRDPAVKIPCTRYGLQLVGDYLADGLHLPRDTVQVEESTWRPGWFRVRVGNRWFGQ